MKSVQIGLGLHFFVDNVEDVDLDGTFSVPCTYQVLSQERAGGVGLDEPTTCRSLLPLLRKTVLTRSQRMSERQSVPCVHRHVHWPFSVSHASLHLQMYTYRAQHSGLGSWCTTGRLKRRLVLFQTVWHMLARCPHVFT